MSRNGTNNVLRALTCLILTLVSSSMLTTSIWGQHSDIEIEVESGQLVTEPRIGEGAFGEDGNPANVADEPGFEIDVGVFQPGQFVGFDADALKIGSDTRHLWYWNGVGAVTFGPTSDVIADHQLSISHPLLGSSLRLTDAGGAAPLPGFLIMQADGDGFAHQDLEFRLVKPDGSDILAPEPGVYLFGFKMTSSSYLTSDPVYFVLGSGVTDVEVDAAIDEVTALFSVPEPASLGLFVVALGMFGRTLVRSK